MLKPSSKAVQNSIRSRVAARGWLGALCLAPEPPGAYARTTGAGGRALHLVVNRPTLWDRGSVLWGSPSSRPTSWCRSSWLIWCMPCRRFAGSRLVGFVPPRHLRRSAYSIRCTPLVLASAFRGSAPPICCGHGFGVFWCIACATAAVRIACISWHLLSPLAGRRRGLVLPIRRWSGGEPRVLCRSAASVFMVIQFSVGIGTGCFQFSSTALRACIFSHVCGA